MWHFDCLKLKNIFSHRETEFLFKEGVCTLITASNYDTPNGKKRSNGGGKSSIFEGIYLALKGEPLRPSIRLLDVVRRGQKEGEIEVLLSNPTLNSTLQITRKFYPSNKAAEVSILYNQVPKNDFSNTNERNDFIFKTLGVSKEDFDRHYLISKFSYRSFFTSPDSEKKEIIGRFTKATPLDSLQNILDEKIEAQEFTIKSALQEVSRAQGMLDAYTEQLKGVDYDSWLASKNERIQTLEDRIVNGESNISELQVKISSCEESIVSLQVTLREIETIGDPFLKSIEEEKVKKQKVLQKIQEVNSELSKIEDKYRVLNQELQLKIQNHSKLIQTKQSEISANNKEILEFSGLIEKLQQDLKGAVQCPECSHLFSLRDKEFSYSETEERIKEGTQILQLLNVSREELQGELKELNTILLQLQNETGNLREKKLQESSSFEEKLSIHSKVSSNITQVISGLEGKSAEYRAQLQSLNSQIKTQSLQLDSFKNTLSTNTSLLQSLRGSLINLQYEQYDQNASSSLLEKIKNVQELLQTRQDWHKKSEDELTSLQVSCLKLKKFKNYLIQKTINSLSSLINSQLEGMSSELRVKIEAFKLLADGKTVKDNITTFVLKNGVTENYFNLSGGEKATIECATLLTLQNLINSSSPTGGVDFVGIDEILESLDEVGLQEILKALQSTNKTILLITHGQLQVPHPYNWNIVKRDGVSSLS